MHRFTRAMRSHHGQLPYTLYLIPFPVSSSFGAHRTTKPANLLQFPRLLGEYCSHLRLLLLLKKNTRQATSLGGLVGGVMNGENQPAVGYRWTGWRPLHTQGWRPMTIAVEELSLVERAERDRPTSLHTWRWRPEGPKKTSWTKSLHGVLRDGLWTRFHGLPEFSSHLPPRGGPDINFGRPWLF